jgi:hypothetical protein
MTYHKNLNMFCLNIVGDDMDHNVDDKMRIEECSFIVIDFEMVTPK